MSLQKKTKQAQKYKKRDIFFIVHFSRQTNGWGWTPNPPLRTPLLFHNL